MADLSAIAGLMTSLKASSDILGALVGLRDFEAVRSKTFELQAELFKANSFGLAAQSTQAALSDRVRELEDQIRKHENWGAEKERYALVALHDGALAYQVKHAVQGAEPMHYICATCYQSDVKSLLQGTTMAFGGHVLRCPVCKTEITHSVRE